MELKPEHVYRRIDGLKTSTFEGMYHSMETGALLQNDKLDNAGEYQKWWQESEKIITRAS